MSLEATHKPILRAVHRMNMESPWAVAPVQGDDGSLSLNARHPDGRQFAVVPGEDHWAVVDPQSFSVMITGKGLWEVLSNMDRGIHHY